MSKVFKVLGFAALLVALSGFLLGAYALTDNEILKAQEAASKGGPVGPPMTLDHGGPDGGGYYFIDSDDDASNAPVFEWVDISGIGVPVTLGDDVNVGPFDLGFTVTYYGADYTSIRIASNGFATFTSTSGSLSNVAIPTAGEPNNLLAVFWDDSAPHNGGQVYYYATPPTAVSSSPGTACLTTPTLARSTSRSSSIKTAISSTNTPQWMTAATATTALPSESKMPMAPSARSIFTTRTALSTTWLFTSA